MSKPSVVRMPPAQPPRRPERVALMKPGACLLEPEKSSVSVSSRFVARQSIL